MRGDNVEDGPLVHARRPELDDLPKDGGRTHHGAQKKLRHGPAGLAEELYDGQALGAHGHLPRGAPLDGSSSCLHTALMTSPLKTPDPNGPVPEEAGLYGFDVAWDDAGVVVIPVPVEATTSYRPGTGQGPEAVRRASHQVDLYDVDVGEAYALGIRLEEPLASAAEGDGAARLRAVRAIDAQARGEPADEADLEAVQAFQRRVEDELARATTRILEAGKLPVVLGGDHSVPLGAIRAAAAAVKGPLGILHLDAHADLRVAYEGFTQSHASIMHNVLEQVPGVRLVQVGLRDVSAPELDRIRAEERVRALFAPALRRARLAGGTGALLEEAIAHLPQEVWVSFDIDGLDPVYCPNTGTPVPGGLTFDEAVHLLEALARSGRRVVGLDLCEVAPPPLRDEERPDEWDALVGARLLYKMIGFALGTTPNLP
jgi:agmatinase